MEPAADLAPGAATQRHHSLDGGAKLGPAGILRELGKARYGFHIVPVDRRIPGSRLPVEMACDRIMGS